MHVRQSYSVSLCTCFGAKTLHNINNLGLCIKVHVFLKKRINNTLSIRLDMSHGTRKSVFWV